MIQSQKEPILLCKVIFASIFPALLYILIAAPSPSHAKTAATLSLNDCPKCHINIVEKNSANGRAHKTKVTCVNCHEGHPPSKRNIIPRCQKCHTDREHFTLPNCLECHRDPHTPLKITLPKHVTYPCTTCHKEQIKQLQKYPSIHSTLDCNACHTRHGYKPSCFNCHAPHLPGMILSDCLDCHKPHMPLMVTYGPNIPSDFCGSCHSEVYKTLGRSHAKHRAVPCARCHEAVHKTIPTCNKCHQKPHQKSMIQRFKSCLDCHKNPHDLKLNKIDMSLDRN